MSLKCVHKGCGKKFSDPEEPCTYHPGPPIFHEGQKGVCAPPPPPSCSFLQARNPLTSLLPTGWKCCKPRVLTFDEFLSIPPCTTGKHSTVDDTPVPAPSPASPTNGQTTAPAPRLAVSASTPDSSRAPQPQAPSAPEPPAQEPESDEDDPALPIPPDTVCRRRACGVRSTAATSSSREGEECVYHPGHPIFHEGTKGWTCCKRRVLEFDEFMQMKGCATKERHMFVGSGKKGGKGAGGGEEKVESVKYGFFVIPSEALHILPVEVTTKRKRQVWLTPEAWSQTRLLPNPHHHPRIPLPQENLESRRHSLVFLAHDHRSRSPDE